MHGCKSSGIGHKPELMGCRYILNTKLGGEVCIWCYSSAFLSFLTLLVGASSLSVREAKQIAAPGLGTLAATVLGLSIGFAGVSDSRAEIDLPYVKPEVINQ